MPTVATFLDHIATTIDEGIVSDDLSHMRA
jgi:hypothetical protein